MALNFSMPRPESRLVLPDGTISRDWYLFIAALLQSVGGPAVGPDNGITPANLKKLIDALTVSVNDDKIEIAMVDQSAIAELDKQFADLQISIESVALLAETRKDIEDLKLIVDNAAFFGELRKQINDIGRQIEMLPDPTAQLAELKKAAMALDIRQTAASTAVPTTPTVLVLPTIAQNKLIDYNTSTGEITLREDGEFNFVFMFNVTVGLSGTLFYGADVDSGSGYAAFQYSGRQASIGVLSNNQILFQSANYFSKGTKIRIYVWASGAGTTFTTTALTALPTGAVSVPGVRIMVTGR